jgi:catechol 2,3-dioxygenase-like lactoylglutathione lyase family enzyme
VPASSSSSSGLTRSHATVAVRDLDAMLDLWCGVLGFVVTNRGEVGEGEMAFISQDPTEHHH